MQGIDSQIVHRIRGTGRGSVFSPHDFINLGSRDAVDKALSRLARKGTGIRSSVVLSLGATHPSPVSLDPLRARRRRIRKGEREDRDRLSHPPASAYSDDVFFVREVNTLDRDLHAEDFRLERHDEVILQHRVER